MKNSTRIQRIHLYLCVTLVSLFASISLQAQQVVKVGAGEYLTVYLMSNRTVKVSSQSTITPILTTYPGLDSVIDVQGGQYHVTALDQQGKVYKLDKYATSVMTAVDEFGAAFTGNFQVKGFWQSNVSIRGVDSSLWYWGIADPMNYNGGADITAPIKLSMPVGKKFKKVETGASSALTNSYILALASDNTVWRYDRGNPNPYQITISGETFVDIATLGSQAQVLQTASNKLFAAGYYSSYAGTPTNTTTFTNVTSVWVSAGVVFPIKELVGNSSTLHIIDANNNMFGSGTNVQGEVGTGVEYSPYRIAGPQGGVFGYGFTNGVLLTPPTQIQGKFKNLNTSTTITFYLYVQDMGNNWYSWGRNKSFSLGNGKSIGPYAGWGGTGDYAAYPNAMDVPMPKRINPASVVWVLQNFDPNASQPPVVGAGINQYLSSVSSTTLYGKAFQQEFSISSSTWTKVSGPAGGTITNPNSLNTTITSLQNGTYVYRLSATNSNGQTSTDDVSIIVTSTVAIPANSIPTVNAGIDQTITLPTSTATLNGTAADSDGTINSYLWAKISGPVGGTIATNSSASTSITALQAGTYIFNLTVTDNTGATAKDSIQILVKPAINQAPIATTVADTIITLPANTTSLRGDGTDADGTIASYQWVKIAGPATGSITNSTSANTTATGLTQGIYKYQLTVTDNSGSTGRDTLQVTVNAASNIVPTANAGNNITITLPTNSTALNGSGTDPDGTIASYVWLKISGPATGTITNANTASATASGLVQGVYSYQLTVVDNAGAIGRDTVIVVTMSAAINQAPIANAGKDKTIKFPTNRLTLDGRESYDVDGTIRNFQWSLVNGPSGTVLITSTKDTCTVSFTNSGTYLFSLSVTDNAGLNATAKVQVVVQPADVISKALRVNIYNGSVPFDNSQWNNWKPVANVNSTNFKYEDGTQSSIFVNLLQGGNFSDNGTNYAPGATVCPVGILRFNSMHTISRTFVVNGLSSSKKYRLEFYGSRAYTSGSKTIYKTGNVADTIDTDFNINDFAKFNNISPATNGSITFNISSTGTYNYLAGFTIIEQTSATVANEATPESAIAPAKQIYQGETISEMGTNAVSVFPNPFVGSFKVQINNKTAGDYVMKLSSTTGQTVFYKKVNKTTAPVVETINVNNLPSGTYILQIISVATGNQTVHKVIKN